MEQVEVLPLVLVKSLDLGIEDRLGIDDETKTIRNELSQTLLVLQLHPMKGFTKG